MRVSDIGSVGLWAFRVQGVGFLPMVEGLQCRDFSLGL